MSNEIEQWIATARAIEIQKAGDAQALIDWYNAGADGQINWGTAGDFDACVAIAGKHLDNPEGFCQLRHMDATGEPAGKASGEIAKGDFSGHPFRGNQYVNQEDYEQAKDVASKAKDLANFASKVQNTPDADPNKVHNLQDIAGKHAELARAHFDLADKTNGLVSQLHFQSALAHDSASKQAGDFARSGNRTNIVANASTASTASQVAAGVPISKADDEPDYTKLISNSKGEPDDQELYNKVKAEAKEKFAVYPSAVANGWVVQEYKRRGGTYSKTVAKGDLTGHAFHGNQYETGESGTSAQSDGSRQRSGDSAKPVAKKLALLLHERAVKNEPEISREINETCQQTGGVRIKPEFVLKDVSSIQRKLLLDSSEYLDTAKGTVEIASANLGDTVRYTISYPTEKFSEGVTKALSDFKTEGFDAIKVKNFFNDDPQNSYRGINCVFHDSTTNQLFEVQFHTPESLAVQGDVHPIYESVRVLDPTSQAYADGQAKMISMWQGVTTPAGVEGIGKYSVKKDAKMLYFYDFTKPEAGILGTATLSDGKFTNLTGIAEEYINYDRDKVKRIFKEDATDESVYDDLNGWSDGSIFCVDEQKSWSIG